MSLINLKVFSDLSNSLILFYIVSVQVNLLLSLTEMKKAKVIHVEIALLNQDTIFFFTNSNNI